MKKQLISKKQLRFIVYILFIFLLGCGQDIEDLSLVIGSGLDLNNSSNAEDKSDDLTHKKNIITTTIQIILPKILAESEGGPQKKPFQNLFFNGDSIHQSYRGSSLTDNNHLSAHQKVIVIGEQLARKIPLEKFLSAHIRDNEIRRSCAVIIAKGQARDLLESSTTSVPVNMIMSVLDNQNRNLSKIPMVTLGRVSSNMAGNANFLVPTFSHIGGRVKIVGAAIINGNSKKLVGSLNTNDIQGWNWLTGEGKGGIQKLRHQKNPEVFVYEVKSLDTKVTPIVKGRQISFHVKTKSKGRLSEDWSYTEDSFDSLQLKKKEQRAEREVKKIMHQTLTKLQKVHKTDVIGFGKLLQIHYPDVWSKVKTNWNKEFTRLPVKIDVDLTIEDYGGKGIK